MSQCSKDRSLYVVSKYLLIFFTGILLLCFSNKGFSQDTSRGRRPPPPPPHPKLKEMVNKIKNLNPFKKHKDEAPTNENAQAAVKEEPKKQDVPPPPPPAPEPVKPKTNTTTNTTASTKTGTTHKTSTKKKTNSTKPATDSKGKVTTPVI